MSIKHKRLAIVAIDDRNGIAKDGKIAWDCPDDMSFFRSMTINGVVIMGSKTFDSLPNKSPLRGRLNIVVTSQPRQTINGHNNLLFVSMFDAKELLRAPEEFIDVAKYDFLKTDYDLCVIGGNQIFAQLVPSFCDIFYVSRIKGDFNCDLLLDSGLLQLLSDNSGNEEIIKETSNVKIVSYSFAK